MIQHMVKLCVQYNNIFDNITFNKNDVIDLVLEEEIFNIYI